MKRIINNEIELVTAFKECKEKDVIIINSGTYYLSDTLYLKTSNVKVKGDLEDRPILDFSQTPHGTNGFVIECDNVTISNLIIQYSGYKGLLAKTNNSTLENINTLGNCDTGLQLKNSSNTKVVNCCSYENFDYMSSGFNSDGFSDKQYEGEGNQWINCKAWKNGDDGFDFYERITPEDKPTTLKNCVSFDNGFEVIDVSKSPRKKTDTNFFKEHKKELNRIPSTGSGNGFKLGGNKTKHNIKVENCLSFNNMKDGFTQNNNIGKIEVESCVASNNKRYNFILNNRTEEAILSRCISTKGNNITAHKKPNSIYGENIK